MNLKGLFRFAAALAAVVTAVIVCVIAAAFAIYALAKVWLGPAGAAAVTAAVFAAAAVVVALAATAQPDRDPEAAPTDEATLVDQLICLARQKPLIAVGAAAALATVLFRKPALLTTLVSAFLAGQAAKPEK